MADPTPFPVDLDAEAIFVDGNWYTREDLAHHIKAMLDQGEFSVARPSSALEQLTTALRSVRTMAFRAPAELADAISQIANRSGVTVGQVLREAAMGMVKAARLEVTARVPVPQPPGQQAPPPPPPQAVRPVTGASPIPPMATPSHGAPVAPPHGVPAAQQQAETGPAVMAGPGALRSAGVAAEEKPVELTNKKASGEEVSSEHRWFKQ